MKMVNSRDFAKEMYNSEPNIRMLKPKRCKVCKKILKRTNKSMLCSYHYVLNWMKGGKNGN